MKRLAIGMVALLLACSLAYGEEQSAATAMERAAMEADVHRQRTMAKAGAYVSEAEVMVAAENYVNAEAKLRAAERLLKKNRDLSLADRQPLLAEIARVQILHDEGHAEYLRVREEKASREIAARDQKRQSALKAQAQRRLTSQWARLNEFRDRRMYNQALGEARAILKQDPNDYAARRVAEKLEYLSAMNQALDIRANRREEMRLAMVGTEESATPYSALYRYPPARQWQELSLRRLTRLAREQGIMTEQTRAVNVLSKRVNMNLEEVSLDNALQFLGEQAGVAIMLDPHIENDTGMETANETVTAKIKQVTLERALLMILPEELGFRAEEGHLVVSSKEKANPLRTATYSVRHLVAEIPDFGKTVPKMDLVGTLGQTGDEGGGGSIFEDFDTDEGDSEPAEQKLMDLIKKLITSNDSRVGVWDDMGGPATIDYYKGTLIVSQTDVGHRKVVALLNRL